MGGEIERQNKQLDKIGGKADVAGVNVDRFVDKFQINGLRNIFFHRRQGQHEDAETYQQLIQKLIVQMYRATSVIM